MNLRICDHVGQAIGTQQQAIAVFQYELANVRGAFPGGEAERFRQRVSKLVSGNLMLGDDADVHQPLGHGVIVRELIQLAVPQQVSAGISEVGNEQIRSHAPGHGP